MSFPSSPSNNQQATINGIVYSYSTSTNAWVRVVTPLTGTTSSFTVSSIASSTSTTSGALIVTGGVGIGGAVNIGQTSTIAGAVIVTTATIGAYSSNFSNYATTATTSSYATTASSISISTASTGTYYLTFVSTTTGNLNVVSDAGGRLSYNSAVGQLSVNSTASSTSTTTGALVVSGGVGISGALNVGSTVTGITGVFYGTGTCGTGALYAGVTGYTPFAQTIGQFTGNLNSYMEVNVQNINSGTQASTDIVASANDVGINNGYIDMGITSGNWNGTQPYSLGTALAPNDGYVLVGPNAQNNTGNLVFGTTTTGTNIKFVVAATNAQSTLTQVTTASIVMVVNAVNTPSTSTTTGALVVTGGVGVGGNLNISGNIVGGGVRSTSASTPPANPTVGDVWYNTTNDDIARYTIDGNGTAYWLDITGPSVANATGSGGSGGASSGLSSSGGYNNAGGGVFYENNQIVSANYTIGTGNSAVSAGPVTVASGVVVTIPAGSKWVIL